MTQQQRKFVCRQLRRRRSEYASVWRGGRYAWTACRTWDTWTASRPCAFWRASEARQTAWISCRRTASCRRTVARRCASAGALWGATSWRRPCRSPGYDRRAELTVPAALALPSSSVWCRSRRDSWGSRSLGGPSSGHAAACLMTAADLRG